MAAAIQDFQRSESERLSEVKGHLEIALLEKHFLRKYTRFSELRMSPNTWLNALFLIVYGHVCPVALASHMR